MLANNETGVLQPLDAIIEICEPMGIPVHVDAVQAIGKTDVHFQNLGGTPLWPSLLTKFMGQEGWVL